MDIKALLNSIVDVAEKAGPLLGPAGLAGAVAIDAVRDMVNNASAVAAETDQPALKRRLEASLTRMNDHADRTIDSLD